MSDDYVSPAMKLRVFLPQFILLATSTGAGSLACEVTAKAAMVPLIVLCCVAGILAVVTTCTKADSLSSLGRRTWHDYLPKKPVPCASCERLAKDNHELREAICTLKVLQ